MHKKEYIFDDKYIIEKKGIPLVSFCQERDNITPPKNSTHMHYHSDYEIIYVCRGTLRMLVAENEIIANAGDTIFINPYETHFGEILSTSIKFYCVDFSPDILPILYDENNKYVNHIQSRNFESVMHSINSAYENTPDGWQYSALGNLFLLLGAIDDCMTTAHPQNDKTFTKNVLDYLARNYQKNISSKSAAEHFGYDQSYFCRLFKKCFSVKFSEYLKIYRIKKSKDFLKTENISESAVLSGFSSISYFSEIFKSVTGITPSDYKKQQTKKLLH